jgi:hypothetical protein
MNRWTWFTICVLVGLLSIVCGWLMPAHLRAIEAPVLKRAGQNSSSVTGRGQELLHIGQFGAAELLSRTAQHENLPGASELVADLAASKKRSPAVETLGVSRAGLGAYFPKIRTIETNEPAFKDFVVREENRKRALQVLHGSKQAAVQELLKSRSLTNTTTFAPSQAPGGEAFDTAVVITTLLLEQGRLTATLSNDIQVAASQANQGGQVDPLEQVLLDFLSLGQRFDWGQLVAFSGKIDSAATLHDEADLVRRAGDELPELFSAVELSGDPHGVAHYLKTFPQTGLHDVVAAFPYGAGGVRALLRSDHRLYTSRWRQLAAESEPFAGLMSWMADYCWRMPEFALIVKWLLYLGGGFLLAMALHLAQRPASALEAPLQVRGIHFAREILFALGFLLVVLLVSEPFLAQEHPAAALPFRLRVPMAGSAVPAGSANFKTSFMDKSNLLPMLLFFVLQALLYVACLVKLAEIRRQRVGPRVKIKLLENEEHLFDGGLYLGFLGTIVSFIVYSVYAKHQFSLMVAYSSTSFGILFVSFFKIFHLRPVRRKLLLEAEAELPTTAAPAAAPYLAPS